MPPSRRLVCRLRHTPLTVPQDHGLARHAMAVYERAAQKVETSEKLGVWQLYIKRASSIFGVPHTRELFEKAIESLPDKDAYIMCMQFADVERKVPRMAGFAMADALQLGEIDRARAVYSHASQFCDPNVNKQFWDTWNDFEA